MRVIHEEPGEEVIAVLLVDRGVLVEETALTLRLLGGQARIKVERVVGVLRPEAADPVQHIAPQPLRIKCDQSGNDAAQNC